MALQRARVRRERREHLVEGPHAVAEAVAAGVVTEVYLTDPTLSPPGLGDDVQVVEVAPHVLERVTDAATPQGIVAVARTRTEPLEDVVGSGLLVVLAGIADPGNAGTIVRTADAVGAAGVVLTSGSVDVFGPKAIRSAAGSTYHLPLVVGADPLETVRACREVGQAVYGLDGAARHSVFALPAPARTATLVLGSEAHGLAPELASALDGLLAVPMRGRAESLNVAAAAAVALYAVAEQLT